MKYWKTRDGEKIKNEDMTDSHILNAWRMFGTVQIKLNYLNERDYEAKQEKKQVNKRVNFLKKEAKRRNLELPELDETIIIAKLEDEVNQYEGHWDFF